MRSLICVLLMTAPVAAGPFAPTDADFAKPKMSPDHLCLIERIVRSGAFSSVERARSLLGAARAYAKAF